MRVVQFTNDLEGTIRRTLVGFHLGNYFAALILRLEWRICDFCRKAGFSGVCARMPFMLTCVNVCAIIIFGKMRAFVKYFVGYLRIVG